MAQEILRATIPATNKWHTEDVEARAKELGMEKTEFILKAVDMMMNFDNTFFKKIQEYSAGLNTPEYMVIQNMIIKNMALDAAKVETDTWGGSDKLMSEFQAVNEKGTIRMLTGEELFNNLKEEFIFKIKNNK
nr:MAG TPA: hypothetical protein [Caudoviricetes sp.]